MPRETEAPDLHSASDEYAARFSGEVGRWMLEVQHGSVTEALRSSPGASVLDVGGGHGQIALPLAASGYDVTVLASSEPAGRQVAAAAAAGTLTLAIGGLGSIPFRDRSFDAVTCFRIVSHYGEWHSLVGELCRVARASVVIDYPSSRSVNAVSDLLFGLKKRVEGNTRTFTVFRDAEVAETFARHGFAVRRSFRQFALPMVLHRAMKSRAASAGLERIARAAGLTALAGSPVVLHASRE